ncbi:MAG: thiamine-phosphate kinase [Burkholderiaceae bacterium]
MTEFELIRRYFDRMPSRRVDLGIGDDCALLRPRCQGAMAGPASPRASAGRQRNAGFAVSTDMLVAGRHFFEDVQPGALGHKTLAVSLSDLAAMGARPRAFTLALALPEVDESWLEAFARGMFELADRYDCELIGGDTTRGPLNLCVTVFGDCDVETVLRRDRAEPGDDVWVSGPLGLAAYAVRERLAGRRLPDDHPAVAALDRPTPRVELGLLLRHWASSAIDVSDGLIGDLGHVAERSRVGIDIEWARVPVPTALRDLPATELRALVLGGGDDYELAFTSATVNRSAIEALGGQVGLSLARVGSVRSGSGVTILDAKHQVLDDAIRAFDHFA